MIKYTENISQSDLSSLPDGSLKVKIESLYGAYGGKTDFLDFWVQKENDSVTALLCRLSGILTVHIGKGADLDEITEFAKAVSGGIMINAELVGCDNSEILTEMKSVQKGKEETPDTPDIKKLYGMLLSGEDGKIDLPPFDEWYVDMSHRLRHGTAAAVLGENSAAVVGFISKDGGLISGVATEKEARGNGYGKEAVLSACSLVFPKPIYAICDSKTVAFYKKCGFIAQSKITYIIFGGNNNE